MPRITTLQFLEALYPGPLSLRAGVWHHSSELFGAEGFPAGPLAEVAQMRENLAMDGTLSLKQILSRLAGHAAVLQGRGVLHAAIFGSVARGEARADSDVDVLVELDSNAGLTLLDYVAVKNLADRGGWHPGIRVNGFKANR